MFEVHVMKNGLSSDCSGHDHTGEWIATIRRVYQSLIRTGTLTGSVTSSEKEDCQIITDADHLGSALLPAS